MKNNQTMNKNCTVLCVAAHPDDEALGVGGTLIRHVQNGDEVFVIILSEGEDSKSSRSPKDAERISRAEEWCRITGATLHRVYDFTDQRLDTAPRLDIVQNLEKDISEIQPDVIYLHHPGDINLDHQIAGEAVLTAARPMATQAMNFNPELLAFETPSSTDQGPQILPFIFQPNHYVDVGAVWEKKMKALQVYKNELGIAPHPRSPESIKALSVKRGAESGLLQAEAFVLLRRVIKG